MEIIEQREVLGKDFKIYGDFENPLFLAKDVAIWIDYDVSSVNKMLNNVDDDEKTTRKIIPNGSNYQTEAWFLTEDGLYEVLMQSRKPIAKQFKKQVKAILKEIRKTGSYSVQKELFIPSVRTYLGEKVVTIKDVSHLLKRSKENISYLLTKCEKNIDFTLLKGKHLERFKQQNLGIFTYVKSLIIIFESGFIKICDMLGMSYRQFNLFPLNRSFARPKDNPEIQGWIDDIKGHMDALELLLFKYGQGNSEKVQESLKEVLKSVGFDIWESIHCLTREDYKLVKQ